MDPDNDTIPNATFSEDVETSFENSDMVSVTEDTKDEEAGSDPSEFYGLIHDLKEKFDKSRTKRHNDETRWMMAYRNYRGIYGPDVQFSEHEKSRVFVKITKVKVLSAYGQLVEVLFGSHKFPLTIEPSELPDGVAQSVHLIVNPQIAEQMPEDSAKKNAPVGYRFKDTGEVLPINLSENDLNNKFGYLKDFIEPLEGQIREGEGKDPKNTVTFHPALVAAKKMEKKIHDQLQESQADKHLRHTAFEMALFGTGIMKGPFVVDKEYPNWEVTEGPNGPKSKYKPLIKTVPMFESVGIWDFYPDPEAENMESCEYNFQRHKLSSAQLRDLASRPYFRENQIEGLIEDGPNYVREWWEHELDDSETDESGTSRWEVLEFWGYSDTEDLIEYGIKVPRSLKKQRQIACNIWFSGNRVIRAVLNPYKPAKIPYYAVPYELNPYSFFGVGVAENMNDSQMLINGFMRMAVDNQALSGNLIFEVDATNLAPGQDLSVYPGKVFVRESGAPGQAIFGTEFPNVAKQNMELFAQARMLADESTGIPSYAHGQTNVQNAGRTASGISMLMNASAGSIRTVVKNLDDYLLRPLGKAIFSFNMQFDPDTEIKGDLEVKAKGTESLMANEVRSQRLMQFLGVVANPQLAPFAKLDKIVREIAKSLELDPDKTVNNLEDAALMATILQKMNPQPVGGEGTTTSTGEASPRPEGAPTPPNAPAGAQASDPTGAGGGNPGTGQVPQPGEPGFSARNT